MGLAPTTYTPHAGGDIRMKNWSIEKHEERAKWPVDKRAGFYSAEKSAERRERKMLAWGASLTIIIFTACAVAALYLCLTLVTPVGSGGFSYLALYYGPLDLGRTFHASARPEAPLRGPLGWPVDPWVSLTPAVWAAVWR